MNLPIDYARRIVKTHDDAVPALSKHRLTGFIRSGSPDHYTAGVLPKRLARFAISYPDVLVAMRRENSDKIKAAVDNRELDIGRCQSSYSCI